MKKLQTMSCEEYDDYQELMERVQVYRPFEPRRPTAHKVTRDKSTGRWLPWFWRKDDCHWDCYQTEENVLVAFATKEEAQEYCRKERRLEHLRLYDNRGESIDRYTAVFAVKPVNAVWDSITGKHSYVYECLSFSGAPFHPQGVGLHGSAVLGRHLGKRIKLSDFNEDCQQFVLQNL